MNTGSRQRSNFYPHVYFMICFCSLFWTGKQYVLIDILCIYDLHFLQVWNVVIHNILSFHLSIKVKTRCWCLARKDCCNCRDSQNLTVPTPAVQSFPLVVRWPLRSARRRRSLRVRRRVFEETVWLMEAAGGRAESRAAAGTGARRRCPRAEASPLLSPNYHLWTAMKKTWEHEKQKQARISWDLLQNPSILVFTRNKRIRTNALDGLAYSLRIRLGCGELLCQRRRLLFLFGTFGRFFHNLVNHLHQITTDVVFRQDQLQAWNGNRARKEKNDPFIRIIPVTTFLFVFLRNIWVTWSSASVGTEPPYWTISCETSSDWLSSGTVVS